LYYGAAAGQPNSMNLDSSTNSEAFMRERKSDITAMLILAVTAIVFYAATFNRSSYIYILRADEGLSFATAMRVLQGFVPQMDFPSYYGPVMPYVYAAVFKIFGASIAVMRAFWAFLFVLSIVGFYRIARSVLPPFASFAAAFMMIGQQHTPLYTYNHIGLVLGIQGILLLLLRTGSVMRPLSQTGFGLLLLLTLLIKFNEALVFLACVIVALWIVRRFQDPEIGTSSSPISIPKILGPALIAIVCFAGITAALNAGLSRSEFLRNFPVLPQYQASIGGFKYVKFVISMPFRTAWNLIPPRGWYTFWYENYMFSILISFLLAIGSLIFMIRFFLSRSFRSSLGPAMWKSAVLIAAAVGMYHEFYLTGNHWSTPMYIGFALLAFTLVLWQQLARFPKSRAAAVSVLLLVCVVSGLNYVRIVRSTFSQVYLDAPEARIYSSSDSDAVVVADVVKFLRASTPNEPMAAFPHDALLVYLAGRQNAMRDDDYQWMLFPTEESDREIVRELDKKKVKQVLISSFAGIRHGRVAVFGRDFLPKTFAYLESHYHIVKSFGPSNMHYYVEYRELNEGTPSRTASSKD
jgi:hypothetical protein